MITPEEFVTRWGNPEELIRYDPAIVDSLAIPKVSKRFLIEAGLPREMATVQFGLPSNQLPHASGLLRGFDLSADYARYRLLGVNKSRYPPEEYNELFCLDEQDGGKVVSIAHIRAVKDGITYMDTQSYSVYTLNTNVPYLAEMLLLIEEDQRWRKVYYKEHPDIDYNVLGTHFKEVARAMRKVDRKALRGKQGWYDTILDFHYGE